MKETDIDRLRSQWKNMDLTSEELDRHAREVADALARNRTVGARQKLCRRLKRIGICCCLGPLWLWLDKGLPLSWWFQVAYVVFFGVMAVLHYIQYRSLGRIDLIGADVVTALKGVYRFRLLRRRSILLGYLLAIPLLVWLFTIIYATGHGPFIAGAWSGLVVGLAIGLYQEFRLRQLLRQMRVSLESMLE